MAETMEFHREVDPACEQGTRLLTICIPTHNRRLVLEECLESVLPQADALGVGVCVSDNGSSDGTWQALETLKRQYPWMQIMRHTRDIGYRGNLIGTILSSRARYVWPLGDKYILCLGALEFVVDELVRLHPSALVVNCPHQFVSTVERMYSVPQLCLRELGWYTTLCGATVLPRQAWIVMLHVQPPSRDFPQVVALFSYLASLRAPQVVAAGRALIQGGKGVDPGTHYWDGSALRLWGRNWYDAVMSLPSIYSTNDKLQAVRSKSERAGPLDLKGLMRLRARGELTLRRLNADQVPLRAAISAPWWSAMIVSVAPRWILRAVVSVHPRLVLRAIRDSVRLPRAKQAH
jgi:hypothetical protein